MKISESPLPQSQLKAHALSPHSDVISSERSKLNGALFNQRRPQELFTNFQLFPSMLPDAPKVIPGRSHQIEG